MRFAEWGRGRRAPRRDRCETCHKPLTAKQTHEVTAWGYEDDPEARLGDGGSVSVTYCREHCPAHDHPRPRWWWQGEQPRQHWLGKPIHVRIRAQGWEEAMKKNETTQQVEPPKKAGPKKRRPILSRPRIVETRERKAS